MVHLLQIFSGSGKLLDLFELFPVYPEKTLKSVKYQASTGVIYAVP